MIDGAALMAEFHDQLEMLINVEDPSQWTLYISAMNIHPVKLLGEQNPAKDAMTRILALLLVSMLLGSAIVSLAPIQELPGFYSLRCVHPRVHHCSRSRSRICSFCDLERLAGSQAVNLSVKNPGT